MQSPKTLPFSQVDVFASRDYCGNPVAVVHAADDLSDDTMATFARWTNLSETTFLLRPTSPDAHYRLRIFTPGGELPFAGHPTLGSCHAWLATEGTPVNSNVIIQECAAGLIPIRRESTRLAFAAPPLQRTGSIEDELLRSIVAALSIPASSVIDHQWVDNGPGWCALLLDSAERVLSVTPNFAQLGDIKLGLVGPQLASADSDFEVRAFVPSLGIPEDPVTGSLNAGIAQWLIGSGRASDSYVVSQGTALQRAGNLFLSKDSDDVWVGGDVCVRLCGTAVF